MDNFTCSVKSDLAPILIKTHPVDISRFNKELAQKFMECHLLPGRKALVIICHQRTLKVPKKCKYFGSLKDWVFSLDF